VNDNIQTENDDSDIEFETWLKHSNEKLIASSAQDLDIEAMLARAKRAAVTSIGTARSKPHHAWRDMARTAVGSVTGALALKPPSGPEPRHAKVLPFPPPASGAAAAAPAESGGQGKAEGEGVQFWIPGAVAGDPESVQLLLAAVRPLVVRYCRARIGRQEWSFGSADDVAQEVCISILRALPRYGDVRRSFLSFVYSIAQHKVADARRAAARMREAPMAEVPDRPVADHDPEQQALNDALHARMSGLLSLLPERQREIVVLRVVVGLSAEETAEAIGSTPGAVRVQQHRALSRLRKVVVTCDV
jgi:RNA polymerase sigma-70 factor (ECF subfamily)